MITEFGRLEDGRVVHKIVLTAGPMQAAVLTYGAILQDLRLAGGPGLTAGSADLGAYADGPLAYAGAIVGPVANRIGGAAAVLDGVPLAFEANAGAHHLHGGALGLHSRVWTLGAVQSDQVELSLDLADGEGGYPGGRKVTLCYRVTAESLTLALSGRTDRPTFLSPANHSYWTLGAGASGTRLQVLADRYLQTDDTVLPTGAILPVAATAFDFRSPRLVSDTDRLDTCFCLGETDAPLRPVARLSGGGFDLEMATTAPGLQVFTADPFADPGPRGHDQRQYGARFGIALEAQGWPDAPNQPNFPSMRLEPSRPFAQTTRWTVSRGDL